MKVVLAILCAALVGLFAGCAGGNGTTTNPPPPPRMLVSDNTSGTVNVVDAKSDTITHTLTAQSPGKMVSAGGTTLIQSTLASSLAIFDNASENIRFNVTLPALAVDIAISPDGKTAWVAESNGTIQSINTASGTITGTATVKVQRMVMGRQGLTMLGFDNSLVFMFAVIPTRGAADGTAGFLGDPPVLDHPADGFYDFDDNNFFVLNCGSECGGTQANLSSVVLNLPGGPGIFRHFSLSAATVGLLSGSTIFTAGSPATGLNAGVLQASNRSATAAGPPINIADGRHNLMISTSNGRLYIGSTGCTLGPVNAQNQRQGCLTIFDPSSVVVSPVLVPAARANGDVTALAPVSGRNVIYVVQGGKLDIFDITTNATTGTPPSFPGTVVGAVQISP
jgi:hypothetical protein